MQPLEASAASRERSPLPELPLVSIVIETVNEATEPEIDLGRVLGGLRRQTYPADRIEVVVVVDERCPAMAEAIGREHPDVRVERIPDASYFAMKREGALRARGEIVALLDSDCDPSPVWVQRIVEHVRDGADVVAGKTRYPQGARYAHTFNFFNFGYIRRDARGRASGFLPNNVAFRREVIQAHNFDPRIRRGGAGHLLGHKLTRLGYRLDYEPEQLATHNVYGLGEELQMRVKAGYDSVNLFRIDADQDIEESRILGRGAVPGLLRIWARRIVFDVRLALTNRADLGIAWYQVPYFLALSPLIRTLELGSALVTLVRPEYFRRKYGW